MSLDTVVEDIREEAQARAADVREAGEERAEEIESAAAVDAEEILEDAEAEIDREIEQLREQRLSSAKLEAKQARLEARRDVLGEVRERVEDGLATLEGDTRERLTRSLLDAASEEFDADSEVRVYGRSEDATLIESILEDSAYDGYELAGETDCLGGVILESEGSRVRINNTFDSILEDVWENILRDISNRLFEQ